MIFACWLEAEFLLQISLTLQLLDICSNFCWTVDQLQSPTEHSGKSTGCSLWRNSTLCSLFLHLKFKKMLCFCYNIILKILVEYWTLKNEYIISRLFLPNYSEHASILHWIIRFWISLFVKVYLFQFKNLSYWMDYISRLFEFPTKPFNI